MLENCIHQNKFSNPLILFEWRSLTIMKEGCCLEGLFSSDLSLIFSAMYYLQEAKTIDIFPFEIKLLFHLQNWDFLTFYQFSDLILCFLPLFPFQFLIWSLIQTLMKFLKFISTNSYLQLNLLISRSFPFRNHLWIEVLKLTIFSHMILKSTFLTSFHP